MPITINCTCGKVFKVKDDVAGTPVSCQICGRELIVGHESAPPVNTFTPLPPLGLASTIATVPASVPTAPIERIVPAAPARAFKMMTCPGCAEQIPSRAGLCPHCGEAVEAQIDEEDFAIAVAEIRAGIAAHLANHDAVEKDSALRGGPLTIQTIVLMVVFGISVLMIGAGILMGPYNGAPWLVFGIMIAVIFVIPVVWSWVNDAMTHHIQDAKTPVLALKRYLQALKSGRAKRAYAALVPAARKVGRVETIKFKAEIPHHQGKFTIDDPVTFKAYWKSIFQGPMGQSRNVTIKNVQARSEDGGMAVVEAELRVTNNSSFTPGLIWILLFQKKENRKIRKLLIKEQGLWFIADGSLEGVIDRAG